jgi:hypothetical protein
LGKKNKQYWKKGLRKWNNNLAQIINNKTDKFKRQLSTETQADKIKYNKCRTTVKKAVCQNRCKTWHTLVTKLEHDITKPKPRDYKII